jgi:hypothetical protein
MSQPTVPFFIGVFRALKIVLRTFTGIRRGEDHRAAAKGLRPQHFIVGAALAAITVITLLVLFVRAISS